MLVLVLVLLLLLFLLYLLVMILHLKNAFVVRNYVFDRQRQKDRRLKDEYVHEEEEDNTEYLWAVLENTSGSAAVVPFESDTWQEDIETAKRDAMMAAEGLSGLDALAAELEAMDDAAPPKHVGYELEPMVGAIKAVGFSGNIALDYRGEGDGTLGVLQTRDAIEAALVSLAEP